MGAVARFPPYLVAGLGLSMRFCDSSHEVTRMQQEGKQQH